MGTLVYNLNGSYMQYEYDKGVLEDTYGPYTISNHKTVTETRPDRVRTRKPQGWLYPKAYTMQYYAHMRASGSRIHVYGSNNRYRDVWTGTACPGVDIFHPCWDLPELPFQAETRAITNCLLKLKDQKVNLGVAWAEAGRTANLLSTNLSRIARAYTSLKRGRLASVAHELGIRRLRQQPSNWLELQYGWMPLLSDIYGSSQELARQPRDSWVMTVKSLISTGKISEKGLITYGPTTWRNSNDRVGEAGFFARLDYIPGNDLLQAASRVGLTNPLEIAWELVPFSFVFDWAIPVGDFLSTLDAALGWDFKSGSGTSFRQNKVTYTNFPNGGYTGDYRGSLREVRMNRKVYSESPLPSAPRIKNPLSTTHVANAFSLVATATGRRGPTRPIYR